MLITHSGCRQDPDRRCRLQQTDRSPRYRLGRIGNATTESLLFQPDRGNPAVRLIGGGVEPWPGWLILPGRRATLLPDHNKVCADGTAGKEHALPREISYGLARRGEYLGV